jgi:predicted DNA-binding transcriptional regulator AlpA
VHLVVVVEDFYADDDNYRPPWIDGLTAVARVATVTDVRTPGDEVDDVLGIPISIAGTDEGDEMMREIIFERTSIVVDQGEWAAARALALLLVEEELRGHGSALVDVTALLEEDDADAANDRREGGAKNQLTAVPAVTPAPVPAIGAIPSPESASDQLLTRVMLRELVPVSDMTLWRWTHSGTFPAAIRFNGRTYWRASEVRGWIEARSQERSPR